MWFKVDDKLHSSHKLLRIPRRHRLACLGLWTIAGSWSADQETFGHIPDHMIEEWGGTKTLVDWLVKVNLWVASSGQDDGKFEFKNWDEYQPTKVHTEAKRKKNREKLAHWRERNRVTDEDVTGLHDGSDQNVTPPPTRPDPTLIKDSWSEPSARPEVEELCTLMADLVEANGSKRPTITKAWRDEARRMLDIDGREPQKVANLIHWVQQDSFWRSNIMSMPKLRKQYDALRLRATEAWEKGGKTGGASPDGQIDVDAILGRDVDGIGTPPEDLWGDEQAEQAWRVQRRAERKAERLAEAKQVLARRQGVTV